ncbi:hypothetical protein TNIN_291631 [Trichonephila inaurata madagascariensis]|uniref:Uncharacterized protein n=1 Tax=Trichonephila inaurata madagascariensis TaxID=2747483 RepID=A0A8X7BU52_9ARAC|nr:hypothetical protein TNIN_291631 [Trichonephila inaurata madagascariensis]
MLGRVQLPSTKSIPSVHTRLAPILLGPSASTPGPSLPVRRPRPGPSLLGPDLALPMPSKSDGRLPPASGRDLSVQSLRRSNTMLGRVQLIDQVRAGPSLLGPIGLVPTVARSARPRPGIKERKGPRSKPLQIRKGLVE